jgi:hypothetical protein
MARPGRPVRRQRPAPERRGRVEHQQYARRPGPEEDLPAGLPADNRHAEDAAVERLNGGQVGGVHGRLGDDLDGWRAGGCGYGGPSE